MYIYIYRAYFKHLQTAREGRWFYPRPKLCEVSRHPSMETEVSRSSGSSRRHKVHSFPMMIPTSTCPKIRLIPVQLGVEKGYASKKKLIGIKKKIKGSCKEGKKGGGRKEGRKEGGKEGGRKEGRKEVRKEGRKEGGREGRKAYY